MAPPSNPPQQDQLRLLADHLHLTLLERQRAASLQLDTPTQKDDAPTRDLETLRAGLEELEARADNNDDDTELVKLRERFSDLWTLHHNTAPPAPPARPQRTPSSESEEAAPTRPTPPRRNKSVRFRDTPDDSDPAETANRTALFASSEQERYRDDPTPDSTPLTNTQIHATHKRTLSDQDAQLDLLGQSVGRQRVLGIQMGDEMEAQNELLGDVEGGVDRHVGTLGRARGRLGRVARGAKGGGSWWVIGVLVLVLVLLIVVLK